ncbi:MAG TPA: hypothetical protein VEN30_23710 [Paraburkholderia sp.]|nr:hypothetical protein [Paraburkholderia sp.]
MEHNLRERERVELDDPHAEPGPNARERLWCIHIEGPDDFIAAASQEAAQQEASAINAYLDRLENGNRVSTVRAVAMEWPFIAESHARSLEVDWDDLQRMPHRSQSTSSSANVLTTVARHLRELVGMTRHR